MRWKQLKASRGVLVGRDFTRIKLDGHSIATGKNGSASHHPTIGCANHKGPIGVFRSKNCNNKFAL
jgi:hypothetical protein